MQQRDRRTMMSCLVAGLLVGGAAIAVQGPLPGDVWVTRSLQAVLGPRPAWAEVMTQMAKMPAVLALVVLACALAVVKGGRSVALLPCLAYPAALLIDFALRRLVHVPRPGADMVAIAKLADGSGLPSTFALVVGCVLGVVVTVQGRGTPVGKAITWIATALIVTGCAARIVLGGHWLSQIAASLLWAFAFALWLPSLRLAPARPAFRRPG